MLLCSNLNGMVHTLVRTGAANARCAIAFSSEVDTGSREENASNKKLYFAGAITTRMPSRGFGIGHICQSGVVPGCNETSRFCRKCRAKHLACI